MGVLSGGPGERRSCRRSSVVMAFVLRGELLFMLLFAEEICVSANFCAEELNLIERAERNDAQTIIEALRRIDQHDEEQDQTCEFVRE